MSDNDLPKGDLSRPIVPDVPANPPTDGEDTRPRDERGRFAPKDPSQDQPEGDAQQDAPPPPKFAPALMEVAKQVLTQDEIDQIPTPQMLLDVVEARRSRLQSRQQTQQNQPQTETVGDQPEKFPSVDFNLEDFSLAIDEDDPDTAKPLKEMASYVNRLKESLVKEIEQLRKKNAELESGVQQSAQTSQQAAKHQQGMFWDNVVSKVPGMAETVGRPSEALTNPNSEASRKWREVAPIIQARAMAQGVPEQYIDFERAVREAWQMYQTINNHPGANAPQGANGRPGTAVRGTPRMSAPPASNPNMSPEQEHEQRKAILEQAWAARGGNPFAM